MKSEIEKARKRRPPGAGTVARMRDKFQVRVPLANGKRRTIGTFDDEAFAEEVRHAAVEELAATPAAAVGGVTLCMFGRSVIDEIEIAGDVRDVRNLRGRFETHVAPTDLGALPVRAITAVDVKAWYRELCGRIAAGTRGDGKKKLSKKTRAEVVRLLKALFEAARSPEHGSLIDSNPAEWIVLRREARTEDPWDYLREHEIRAIQACEDIPEAARLTILFAITTGLRLGEQFNLELEDLVVDGPHPEVTVRYGSKGKAPKNGRIRRVPLFGLGLEVARAWLRVLPSFTPKNPEGLVFPTTTGARRQAGKHLHGSRWIPEKKAQIKVDLFKEYLAAAGIHRPFRWHDLRHTCATALVSGWWGRSWTLAEIGDHLGHVSRTSTERYAHLAETALRRAARETHAASTRSPAPVIVPSPEGCDKAATVDASVAQLLEIIGVGRQGLEPWTYGLKAPGDSEAPHDVSTPRSRPAADPVEVLRAIVRGDAAAARAGGRELAVQVLASPAVRLALQVLAGGEFVDQRIAELCDAMLDAGDVAVLALPAKRGGIA